MTFIALVNEIYFNVKQYGALGDGSSDDTSAIAAANTAAAANGGVVFFPPGTYITTTITIQSNVTYLGAGFGASVVKLKNATNADLFSANTGNINLAGASGTGSSTAVHGFSFRELTLDGNFANQSSGPSYPLRFYGYGYIFSNLHVINGYSGGILCDYFGPFPANHDLECAWSNFKFMDNQGIAVEVGGPSDQQWTNGIIATNNNVGSHDVHVCPNAGALLAANVHMWRPPQGTTSVGLLAEAPMQCVNCEAEGSDTCNVVVLSDKFTWVGGQIFPGGKPGVGIQIGQTAGNTPYAGSLAQSAGLTTAVAPKNYFINTLIHDLTNVAIAFNNDGAGVINARVSQTSSTYTSGTPNLSTAFSISGTGLASTGTLATGGGTQWVGVANTIWAVRTAANVWVSVNTNGAPPLLELPNGTRLRQYSDNYTTRTVELNNGTIALFQSASAAAVATSGTITTNNVGVPRVAPTGNVTAVILQAGVLAGQECDVVNESAFTVTFDVAGTSHVADGASAVIAANRLMHFRWDSVTALWYHS